MLQLLLMIVSVGGPDASTVRQLSLRDTDAKHFEQRRAVVSFVLNTISTKPAITPARLVDDRLEFDLRDYGIDPKLYDAFAAKSPHQPPTAGWFIVHVLKSPDYYKFLGVSDLGSFRRKVSHDDTAAIFRETVRHGVVARWDAIVERTPTVHGWYWERRHDTGDREIVASLPNGLLAYFSADKAGAGLDYSNPDVVIAPQGADRLMRPAISFISFHDWPLDKAHADAVKGVTGMTVAKLSKLVFDIRESYESPLDLTEAARELGVTEERLSAICEQSGNPDLLALQTGRRIGRYRWNSAVREFRLP